MSSRDEQNPILSSASNPASDRLSISAGAEAAGTRLDKFLAEQLADHAGLSRSRLRTLIEQGHLIREAGGTIVEPSYRVKQGERFALTLPPPAPAIPQAQPFPLTIIYEDDALIVIDKPAGLVVHPAPGNRDRTLVNALIAHCGASLSGIGGEIRPGIVHRLDKDTSGLMVAAKTDRAHKSLSEQFAAHGRDGHLTRTYWALVWGVPEPLTGAIEGPIGRSPRNRRKMAVLPRGGRPAITHYKVLKTFGMPATLVSLVECRLETGRTHQIRVHLTAKGHPLLGDPAYGGSQRTRKTKLPPEARAALERLNRQALHARELGFVHPETGEKLRFESAPPPDFTDLLRILESL